MSPEEYHIEESAPDTESRLKICMLASGSSGNSIYISDGPTSILVDAGLSGIEIERRLKSRGLDPEELSALLLTHEHSDHSQGVGVLSRRYSLPVYISKKTKAAATHLGKLHDHKLFKCGYSFMIDNLSIHPFSLSHDAIDTSGFTIERNHLKVGIATDLGIATSMVKEHLKECTALIIEANHDPEMLINGPYPWPLKQRIQSRVGHLSNIDLNNLLNEIKHDNLKHVILAHLSETNNTPDMALNTVRKSLQNTRIKLHVALQDICGQIVEI